MSVSFGLSHFSSWGSASPLLPVACWGVIAQSIYGSALVDDSIIRPSFLLCLPGLTPSPSTLYLATRTHKLAHSCSCAITDYPNVYCESLVGLVWGTSDIIRGNEDQEQRPASRDESGRNEERCECLGSRFGIDLFCQILPCVSNCQFQIGSYSYDYLNKF